MKYALFCVSVGLVSCGASDVTQLAPTDDRTVPALLPGSGGRLPDRPGGIDSGPEDSPPHAAILDARPPPDPTILRPPGVPSDAGTNLDAALALPPQPTGDSADAANSSTNPDPVCGRGELACRGSLMARCNARRSDFELVRDCRDAERCERAARRCAFGMCPEQELGCSLAELLSSSEGVHGLALGRQFTCAVVTAGGVRCWGRNHRGQLGYGHTRNIGDLELPVSAGNVDVGGPVAQIAAGFSHTCALFTNGDVSCWGYAGSDGQLGYGDVARRKHFAELTGVSADVGDDEAPASVGRLDLGGPAIQLAAGENFTCALLLGGDVRCWGEGDDGALGYADTEDIGDDETPASMAPVDLGGPAAFITAGAYHSCAILRTGEVRCWGRALYGRLGYGNEENIGDDETPASAGSVALHEHAIGLSASETHTCAVSSSGALHCWGDGRARQLGQDAPEIVGDDERPTARPAVDLGARVSQVAAGKDYTCALLEGGAVRCWGEHFRGQLGAGNGRARPLSSAAPRVELGGAALQIEAYRDHTCALLATHELICWGAGLDGNLGYGNTEDVGDDETPASVGVVPVLRLPPDPAPPADPAPPPVPEPVPDAGISPSEQGPSEPAPDAGTLPPNQDPPVGDAGVPPTPSCESGVLRCEGSRIVLCNASASGFDFVADCGEVSSCAQAISNCELASCTADELGCAPLPSRRIDSVALGDQHTCALTVAGAVRCWGDNAFGQLGYGHTNDLGIDETATAAADVDVGGPVRQIVAGANHTCALLESGEARCWGQGNNGQLGLGNEANVGDDELPAAVPSIDLGGPTRALAAGGGSFTCALLLNGDVRCWGSGSTGQLGLGSIISAANRNVGDDETPASVGPIDLGAPVAAIASGQNHSCVLSNTGDVRCWGRASGGRLGYGSTRSIGDDETPASAGNVPLGGSAVDLSLGNAHSCAVLSDGAVRCWGSHLERQLGYPDAVLFGANLGDDETPDAMPALDLGGPAIRVAAGGLHSCALLTDGAVRCWGGNAFGQLGSARTDSRITLSGSVPRLELGGDAVVVAGGDVHACAVLASGGLVCWGDVSNGKLGYGQGAGNARVGDDETPASMGVVPLF